VAGRQLDLPPLAAEEVWLTYAGGDYIEVY
jgi:hypothetical protein